MSLMPLPVTETRVSGGSLSDVAYLIVRRMRVPLIMMIVVFTVCTIGLSLMPGVDAQGNPTPPMTMFEAFYVISYTATTIGFGEVPQAYSIEQRVWMVLVIYLSVAVWSYTIVAIMGLVSDKGFQNAVRFGRFAQRVRHLREPFYVVCGAGETGSLVCHGLDKLGLRFVVVDLDDARLQELRLGEFRADAPMVVADAAQPAVLRQAGLESPFCRGVVAVVNDDIVNQAIAVTVRLLAPKVPVLARVRGKAIETHIGVFGGDLVINPFDRFAEHLSAALAKPQRYRLREVLTGLEGDPLPEPLRPPRGHWIMCGYGRFGHAVAEQLRAVGNTVSVIDEKNFGDDGVDVCGTGADENSLQSAGIDEAVGVVAGNASDTKNLAIAVAARDMRPGIFIVTRQNQYANTPLFEAFRGDLPMVPSRIVAQEFLARITTPLLVRFLNDLPSYSEKACCLLADRLSAVNDGRIPVIWASRIDHNEAEGVLGYFAEGKTLTLSQLLAGERMGDAALPVITLLVMRGRQVVKLPTGDFELHPDDEILFAASDVMYRVVTTRLGNVNVLDFVTSGDAGGGGYLWRWLQRRRLAKAPAAAVAQSSDQSTGSAP